MRFVSLNGGTTVLVDKDREIIGQIYKRSRDYDRVFEWVASLRHQNLSTAHPKLTEARDWLLVVARLKGHK